MGAGHINFSPFPFFVSVYVYASGRDFVCIALLSPLVLGLGPSVLFFFFYLKNFYFPNKCFLNNFFLIFYFQKLKKFFNNFFRIFYFKKLKIFFLINFFLNFLITKN